MKKLVIGMMVICSLMATSVVAWCGDNGNGTVTVNGLVWLKDAGCLGSMNWDAAMTRPKSLAHGQCSLTDNSKPGDWRLPTIDELKTIYSAKSQFNAVRADYYWSSSTCPGFTTYAWDMGMDKDIVFYAPKYSGHYVWPVRGGH